MMPNYGLAVLMTAHILMALVSITVAVAGVWGIMRHVTRENNDTREVIQRVAEMQREVAFMIRRQYGDIARDLQEIKEMLGGQ